MVTNYDASFFLVLKETGRDYPKLGARLATRRPNLAAGEVVVELTVSVPRALFQRPTLRARVEVPAGDVPATITADVSDNIARALSEQLGIRVHVTADPPGAE